MAKGKYMEWITEDGLLLIEGWAREGLTEDQIAHNIGICRDTLNDWKNRFSGISDALKKGKAPVDYEAENALLKKALGFTVRVKKPIKLRTRKQLGGKETIEEERVEYAEEEIYIPPDVAACIFWLKNRRPDKWSDRPKTPGGERNELLESLYALIVQDRG